MSVRRHPQRLSGARAPSSLPVDPAWSNSAGNGRNSNHSPLPSTSAVEGDG